MKIYQGLYLMLFCCMLFAFVRNNRIKKSDYIFKDSTLTITGRAKFIKHIQEPCCCFARIIGSDMFEVSYVIKGQNVQRSLTIQYKECQTRPFAVGHYYTFIANVVSGDIYYPSLTIRFTTLDSVTTRFNKAELAPGLKIRN